MTTTHRVGGLQAAIDLYLAFRWGYCARLQRFRDALDFKDPLVRRYFTGHREPAQQQLLDLLAQPQGWPAQRGSKVLVAIILLLLTEHCHAASDIAALPAQLAWLPAQGPAAFANSSFSQVLQQVFTEICPPAAAYLAADIPDLERMRQVTAAMLATEKVRQELTQDPVAGPLLGPALAKWEVILSTALRRLRTPPSGAPGSLQERNSHARPR